ncbi:MAG: hypothetical protein EAZ89_10595 [Bacteroidetes bacterium]|nr:MAG: hypothetical protein EAZ89_10595 [Bacteroidota bacterium]
MMAMEVAKHMETEKVIVISSAKIYTEIPVYYRLAGRLRLHTLLPMRLLKSSNGITNWLFGAHSREEKQLLKQILLDTDPVFLKWAIDKIVRWTHSAPPRHTFHIHGTSDRILPLKYVACDVKIQNGGHLMILDKAEALTHILRQQCSEILLP